MAFTLDVFPAAYINLDLFPAKVRSESGLFAPQHEEYRVIVTDNHLYIIDDTPDGPQCIVTEALTEFGGSNKDGYTVTTEHERYFIERALNCGCGSRLRGLHPFAGVPHTAQLRK
jgi:hypothetical protein